MDSFRAVSKGMAVGCDYRSNLRPIVKCSYGAYMGRFRLMCMQASSLASNPSANSTPIWPLFLEMTSSTESPALFTPPQVSRVPLSYRIVLAPLTGSRATEDHVHTKLGIDYYT